MDRTDAGVRGATGMGARRGVWRLCGLVGHQKDTPLEAAVAGLAARQHGVVTLTQLERLGLSASAVAKRCRAGRLHRVYRGVYSVGHPVLTREGRLMAAALACGPGAVLSHRSAAEVWGLLPAAGWVEVTAAARRRHRGVRAHRGNPTDDERDTRHRLPVTTPARTIVDLADVADERLLERALVARRVPPPRLHRPRADLRPTRSREARSRAGSARRADPHIARGPLSHLRARP